MIRPWLKFYTGDWRSDPALRVCSLAARGLWMEMICIMHEAQPRGSLLVNGQPVSGKQLAMLVGLPLKEVAFLLGELAGAGVFSREDSGTIYSRRMRRDEERSEEGREHISKRYPTRSPSRSPSTKVKEKTTVEPTTLEARSQKEHDGGDARASATSLISPKAWNLAEEIAAIVGFQTLGDWPPGWLGAPYRVQAMLDNGWKPEIMLASTREVMARRGADPPDNIKYFEKAFARAHAQQNAPLPVVKPLEAETTHASSRRGGHAISPITAALDKHLERFERQARDDDEVREVAPRLLSNG